MESRVVLLCLKPYLSPSQINEQTLYSMFSQFAQVTNVSIFACTSVLKAFVEFETSAIARLAVDHFNGRQFNFGSVHVYPSNKSCIKPKPASSSNNRTSSQIPIPSQDGTSKNKKSDTFSSSEPFADSQANYLFQRYSTSGRQLTPPFQCKNAKELSDFLSLENSDESKLTHPRLYYQVNQVKLNPKTHNLWRAKLGSLPFSEDHIGFFHVYIMGLNSQIVNAKILMNLMCCFGNVNQIHYKQSKGLALVLYTSDLEAATAIHYLSSQHFFGATLESRDSPLSSIDVANYDFKGNGFMTINGKKQDFRYKSSLRIKFNAPSSLLHFTNLPDCCTAPILYHIICTIQEPSKIMRLARRNPKDAGMMLVEFENPSKALEVLSVMHNKRLNDNVIRVSFSQTRISQNPEM